MSTLSESTITFTADGRPYLIHYDLNEQLSNYYPSLTGGTDRDTVTISDTKYSASRKYRGIYSVDTPILASRQDLVIEYSSLFHNLSQIDLGSSISLKTLNCNVTAGSDDGSWAYLNSKTETIKTPPSMYCQKLSNNYMLRLNLRQDYIDFVSESESKGTVRFYNLMGEPQNEYVEVNLFAPKIISFYVRFFIKVWKV
jgi:hypothetical protein